MKTPKLEVGSLVLITWDDAFVPTDPYWTAHSDITEIASIRTVGHYLSKSARYLTVAQSSGNGRFDELDGYGGTFSIPVGCIQSITLLKEN